MHGLQLQITRMVENIFPKPRMITPISKLDRTTMNPIRLLVVDNNPRLHELINEFFARFDQYIIVGNALSGNDGIRLAGQLKPDLILLDIRMDDINGIEMIPRLHKILPEVKIIMLTLYDLDIYRQAAEAAGAKGYVLKGDIFTSLIPAIEKSMRTMHENMV